jgi:trigger factor
MQVSLETLSDIERKLTISLPEQDIQQELDVRLKNLAPKVQIHGFRPGKVPFSEVKKRFSLRVREEVIRDFMQKSLQEAIEANQLKLAGYPKINVSSAFDQGDFSFEAMIQVYPEIQIKELSNCEIEILESSVDDADVVEMIEQLRNQHKTWKDVKRAAKEDDLVEIDFKGFIDDQPFEGGEANNMKLVLGEKKFIPGFEQGIIGHKEGDEFSLDIQFPENYGQKELAGKQSRFDIKLNLIQQGELPEVNDEFAEKVGIKGGVEGLKKDLIQNMQRELKNKLSQINRKAIFDKFMEINPLTLPSDLIDLEIDNLKHELYQRVFGNEGQPKEKMPDFPKELFQDEASRRVHLSLLYAEYLKLHDLKVAEDKLDAMLDELVAAYEDSQAAKEWYLSDKKRMANLENLLLEESVADKLLESAKSVLKKLNFRETMNYAQQDNSGEDA